MSKISESKKKDAEDIIIDEDLDTSQFDEKTQSLINAIASNFAPQRTLYSMIDTSIAPTSYLDILKDIKKWKGERFINDEWVSLPPGKYYDYLEGQYKEGTPKLSFFDWYCEFIANETNYAKPAKMGRCHYEWGHIYETCKGNLIMLCPRDHFKSSFLVVGACLHTICEHPDLAKEGLMFISFSDDLARDNLESVKNNLLNNKRITSYYGTLIDLKKSCTADSFFYTFQPSTARPGMMCTSLQSGNITGRHPIRVWCDDIQDLAFSETNMKKAINIFTKKLFPAIGTKGKIIITGTIKGNTEKNDIYLWLSKRFGFETYTFPAANMMPPMSDVEYNIEEKEEYVHGGIKTTKEYNVKVKEKDQYILLYPERYTIEDLVIKRLQMRDKGIGDDIFWSEYFLRAVDPKSLYFKQERLGFLDALKVNTDSFLVVYGEKCTGPVLWIDPGGKGKASHGNTIVIMAQMEDKYILLYFTRVRAGLKETAKIVYALYRRFKCQQWGVEGNFNQAETHGETLYNYIREIGEIQRPVVECNNLPKLIRIRDIFSSMLGLEGTPISFFVNKELPEYEDFYSEYSSFPNRVDKKGEFDILDACCSLKTFILDKMKVKRVMIAAGVRWR